MSPYPSVEDAVPAERLQSTRRNRQGPLARARLYLRETRLGTWVVREESDRRGGSFFTLGAALKFIRREFGADAHVITTYVMQNEAA